MDAGIIADGKCLRYDWGSDEILGDQEVDPGYLPEDLDELFEQGEEMPPGSMVAYGDADRALELYREFLEECDLYSLTATPRYPRGDSTAVYAFGDCNGDGVPELHLEGGDSYRIYTYRGGEMLLLTSFDHCLLYPEITPLKDGAFVGCGRTGTDSWADVTSFGRIPDEDGPFADLGRREGDQDIYFYFRLDDNGAVIDKSSHRYAVSTDGDLGSTADMEAAGIREEEWEQSAAPYRYLLEHKSLHLEWSPVFKEEEWDYLDGADLGTAGPETGDGGEARQAYRRLLSGNFAMVRDMNGWSRLYSRYDESLDQDTGRCRWKYVLKDFNGDGVEDLFVRYDPDSQDYTYVDYAHAGGGIACFTCLDGEVTWWEFDVRGERYVPLQDGRVIFWSAGRATSTMMIGRLDQNFDFVPEKIYEKLLVEFDDYLDKEWYETYVFGQDQWELYEFCERFYQFPSDVEREGEYYFSQDCDGGRTGELTRLSGEQWSQWTDCVMDLMIPDSQWQPASVFMPDRNREEFTQG